MTNKEEAVKTVGLVDPGDILVQCLLIGGGFDLDCAPGNIPLSSSPQLAPFPLKSASVPPVTVGRLIAHRPLIMPGMVTPLIVSPSLVVTITTGTGVFRARVIGVPGVSKVHP
jgi:hypothetical protein